MDLNEELFNKQYFDESNYLNFKFLNEDYY